MKGYLNHSYKHQLHLFHWKQLLYTLTFPFPTDTKFFMGSKTKSFFNSIQCNLYTQLIKY